MSKRKCSAASAPSHTDGDSAPSTFTPLPLMYRAGRTDALFWLAEPKQSDLAAWQRKRFAMHAEKAKAYMPWNLCDDLERDFEYHSWYESYHAGFSLEIAEYIATELRQRETQYKLAPDDAYKSYPQQPVSMFADLDDDLPF